MQALRFYSTLSWTSSSSPTWPHLPDPLFQVLEKTKPICPPFLNIASLKKDLCHQSQNTPEPAHTTWPQLKLSGKFHNTPSFGFKSNHCLETSNRANSTLHKLLPCNEVLQRKAGNSKLDFCIWWLDWANKTRKKHQKITKWTTPPGLRGAMWEKASTCGCMGEPTHFATFDWFPTFFISAANTKYGSAGA